MQTARSHRDSFSLSGMRSRALNGRAEHKRIQRGLVKISLCAMENSRTVYSGSTLITVVAEMPFKFFVTSLLVDRPVFTLMGTHDKRPTKNGRNLVEQNGLANMRMVMRFLTVELERLS